MHGSEPNVPTAPEASSWKRYTVKRLFEVIGNQLKNAARCACGHGSMFA